MHSEIYSYGAPYPSPSTFFRPPPLGRMAGIRYVSCLSSSLRPATAKAAGLRSRYVLARTLATANATPFAALDTFVERHIGPDDKDATYMLKQLGYESMDAFVAATVPAHIRVSQDAITDATFPPHSESELIQKAKALGRENKLFKSYIGMGYHNTVTPPVILRNVSTFFPATTPTEPQREIDVGKPCLVYPVHSLSTRDFSRFVNTLCNTHYNLSVCAGRLESLVNFQTMVTSLTSMDIANASLLDESSGAAEGMVMTFVASNQKKRTFFVDEHVLPQTLSVLRTRAKGFGINLVVGNVFTDLSEESARKDICGVLIQYPDINGTINNYASVAESIHASGGLVVCATDLLALTMLKPPGEWGADVVVGNSGRFGVSIGYGGPHAGFFACTDNLKRRMPGRIVGRSKDTTGRPAYRLALQSKPLPPTNLNVFLNPLPAREQHIRRERATSNICTAQALLANMAAMYAIYHGPEGLTRIARRIHGLAQILNSAVQKYGFKPLNKEFFDTLTFDVSNVPGRAHAVRAAAAAKGVNLREVDDLHVGVTLDETVGPKDIVRLINIFAAAGTEDHDPVTLSDLEPTKTLSLPPTLLRESKFLHHPVFNTHHSETEMLRYIYHLQSKDLGLVHAMIPLGSCTLKLNSTTSLMPVTWPEFYAIHPFAPPDQVKGYGQIIKVTTRVFRLDRSLTCHEIGIGG